MVSEPKPHQVNRKRSLFSPTTCKLFTAITRKTTDALKLRSYCLSFQDFHPLFALFPIVGTGRIDVAREVVGASVVSRVVAVNSSHVKGGDGVSASIHSSVAERFAKPRSILTARLVEIPPTTVHRHEPRGCHATRRRNKALQAHEPHQFFLFRRRGINRTADEARGKTDHRNAA
ncbi:hypothetical protein AVEN_118500-1 [Araneus ventricosus]|uniref:Uncharacterized protein n=1 Tax=Araneus ventricosus TaxID=182803 RepID=A0A4Y2IZX5_ARAVE|nr:hypothetical protein AVEN_196731-1 [Araneus ventricosus]GBM83427.1 hypothetical protein AVEN_118500-1 [Araneus ventricosus]